MTGVGNIQLSRIMGADVRLADAGFGIGVKASWEQALEEVRGHGGVPCAIPAGASDHRLGGLGFANWADEVQEQERQAGVFFDTIVVCAVTGSTQAGMIAGFAGQDRPRRVIGIDASARLGQTRAQVAKIARHTAELIGLGRDLREEEITVLGGWAGDYYGVPDQSTLDAIRLLGRLQGIILDPAYEGEIHGWSGRPGQHRRDRQGLHRALRSPGRPASAQRLRRLVLLGSPANAGKPRAF